MNREKYKELFSEYTRARHEFGKILIEAAMIDWHGPHAPIETWHTVLEISADSTLEEIEAARLKLLKRKRYFKKCQECGELNACGHMADSHICQSCAEKIHGVVF